MRSALDPDGALVMRPAVDPSYVRWLWRFPRELHHRAVPRGDAALAR
jgi:hypothetical protein